MGRVDQQVKVNGFRIELGEVEGKLSNITGVNKATVLVDKSLGGANLVAAIIPEMIMHKDGKISIIEKESECKKYESEEHEIEDAIVRFTKVLTVDNERIEIDRIPKNVKNAFFMLQNYANSHMVDSRQISECKWWSVLESRISIYEDIFNGKISPKVILEDEILSPDELFVNFGKYVDLLDEFIFKLTQLLEKKSEKIKIGLIYGGKGIVFERLLDILERDWADKVEICYFERSEGFIRDLLL